MSIKTSLALLHATSRTRRISTIQTLEWARATYRLSRAIEIAGYLTDTKFLLKEGLTRTQIRHVRLFADFLDTQLLEQLLEWVILQHPERPISRTDVIMELCCTGVPIGHPRFPGAHWQSTGHWGSDGECYYDVPGPAL